MHAGSSPRNHLGQSLDKGLGTLTTPVWASLVVLTLTIVLGGCSLPGSNYGSGHAKVSLLSEKKALSPGQEALLGVHFEIEPGWHLYWNGRNDTGYAPRVTLDLPEGFQAGEFLWPVPKRLISPGGILDHVYEHEVTLLLPLRVPGDAAERSYKIRGEASWLACHEVCVPGTAPFELEIHTEGEQREEETNSSSVEAIAHAKASLPGSDPGERFASLWEGRTLVFSAPEASRMMFFPDTASVEIADLLKTGEVQGNAIRIAPRQPAGTGEISGILGIEIPSDTLYFTVRVPLPQKP
jgi:DsbC/DsbD-like thiol-disulfide interchange protein